MIAYGSIADGTIADNPAISAGGGYTITALVGSYTISGQTATLLRSKLIEANAGAYSYSGQPVTLLRTKLLVASQGTYAYSGQNATLLRSKLITASAGSYTYAGQTATLARSRLLTASTGSYTYTGQSADLVKGRVLNASAGSYVVNGQSVVITFTGAVYPLPSQVLLGVEYGPNGNDYTGTLVPGTGGGIMVEANSGRLIKPLTDKIAILL